MPFELNTIAINIDDRINIIHQVEPKPLDPSPPKISLASNVKEIEA